MVLGGAWGMAALVIWCLWEVVENGRKMLVLFSFWRREIGRGARRLMFR